MNSQSKILAITVFLVVCAVAQPTEAQTVKKVPCYMQGDGLVDDNTKKQLGFFFPEGFEEAKGVKKVLRFDEKMEGGQSKTYGICSVIFK